MKNSMLCVFGLLDLVRNWGNGTVFRKWGLNTVFDPMPISEGVSKNSENLPDN